MSSQQKLKFCANLSMMYAKEAPSLLDRYTLAKSFGFKGVECAFPYEFSKEDLIKVLNLRLWSFMVLTYLHYRLSMMSQGKTPGKDHEGSSQLLRGQFTSKDPSKAVN